MSHQVLSQVLTTAVEGGRLTRNVAAGIKLPKVQRTEMHFLNAEQVETIHPRYGTLIRFAAYSGMRPSELAALRLGRLDRLRGTARVVEAALEVDGHLHWGGVRTHEARTVRLRAVRAELAAHLATRPHDADALVFVAPRGGPLRFSKWTDNYFKRAIPVANERILAAAGPGERPALLPEGLRVYDLRHTCASLLIAEGASIKAVQAQLGHKTASMTLDLYGHLFPDETERLAERMDRARRRCWLAFRSPRRRRRWSRCGAAPALEQRIPRWHGPGVCPLRPSPGAPPGRATPGNLAQAAGPLALP